VICDFVICDSAESDHKIMGRRVQVVAGIIKKLKSAHNSRSCKKFGLLQRYRNNHDSLQSCTTERQWLNPSLAESEPHSSIASRFMMALAS
jgi:hypothetical protein